MKKLLKQGFNFWQSLLTIYYCLISGLKYNSTFKIRGKVVVKKSFFFQKGGELVIGDFLTANSKFSSNSVGLIQPIFFNISLPGSKIIIGENVGISGSTINAVSRIEIGNNVMIGSGCLISDTDSHSLDYKFRSVRGMASSKPIIIKDNVFIGARSIILKGVEIGEGAVIGAGSVVSKNVPPFTVFAGNPAVFIKNLKN